MNITFTKSLTSLIAVNPKIPTVIIILFFMIIDNKLYTYLSGHIFLMISQFYEGIYKWTF